jgi:hypothetical protein
MTATTAIAQLRAAPHMVGRVLALQTVLVIGTTPLGGPLLGALSDTAGGQVPLVGPGVATYTAALISNTAVQAWYDGYRYVPFLFESSAATAAAGFGLVPRPLRETAPVRRLGAGSALAELGLMQAMKHRAAQTGAAPFAPGDVRVVGVRPQPARVALVAVAYRWGASWAAGRRRSRQIRCTFSIT